MEKVQSIKDKIINEIRWYEEKLSNSQIGHEDNLMDYGAIVGLKKISHFITEEYGLVA